MPFSIRFVPVADKQFKKIKDDKLKERVVAALEYIASDPLSGKVLKAEFKGCYSWRFGDYRIIYNFSSVSKVVSVLRIDHRREVYR